MSIGRPGRNDGARCAARQVKAALHVHYLDEFAAPIDNIRWADTRQSADHQCAAIAVRREIGAVDDISDTTAVRRDRERARAIEDRGIGIADLAQLDKVRCRKVTFHGTRCFMRGQHLFAIRPRRGGKQQAQDPKAEAAADIGAHHCRVIPKAIMRPTGE